MHNFLIDSRDEILPEEEVEAIYGLPIPNADDIEGGIQQDVGETSTRDILLRHIMYLEQNEARQEFM